MTRPPRTDFVLGARASTLLTIGAAGLTSVVWLTQHTISWLVPVVSLLLCKASFSARRRITVYRNWRGAWDEMAGAGLANQPSQARPAPSRAPSRLSPNTPPPQEQDKPQPPPRRLRIPRPVLIAVWLVLTCWLKSHQGEPGTTALGIGSLCFFALTLWGAAVACVGFCRWLFRPASASKARSAKVEAANPAPAGRASATDADGNHIVAQCLPVPRVSPPSGHVRDVLPDYCRSLLARSAATSSNNRT
jgi:hypothetical protein